MAFPEDPLGIKGQLLLGGVWRDLGPDLGLREPITHQRGRAYRANLADPSSCSMFIKNLSGDYTPRNPNGQYYGDIGRNTQGRITLPGTVTHLEIPGGVGDRAATPDAAALDITGDIDVRVDVAPGTWRAGDTNTELAGKYVTTGNQRSWLFNVDQLGRLIFRWSPDGTNIVQTFSDASVAPPSSGRLVVRATLDVNDGFGNTVTTFYQGPSMSGPWTTLDTVTTTGTTSIFNSTAALEVGDLASLGFLTPVARFYAFQLRNGINGTVVANPDFSAQAVGTTSFTDSTSKVWTLAGNAQITNRRVRFHGEVPEWPPEWSPSEKDAWTQVSAAGILRRLSQGQKALQSTLRRRIPSVPHLLAYWPMEEQEAATQASSPVAGVPALRVNSVDWAAVDTLPASSPLPALRSTSGGTLATMFGRVPRPAGTPSSWLVQYLYRLDTVNTTLRSTFRILSTGTVAEWYIQIRNDLSRILARDSDGATVFSQDIGTSTDLFNQWMRVQFRAVQNGGNVDWQISWTDVGGDAGVFAASFAGTVGYPTGVGGPPDGYSSDIDGLSIGHISAWDESSTTTAGAYTGAVDAWAGETAGDRVVRLCGEEGVPLSVVGNPSDSVLMGPQRPAKLLDLLTECAEADSGILGEQRDLLRLWFRPRSSLYNQGPKLTLDYAAEMVAPPFKPIEDDQVRNDRTVQREGGSSGRAVLEEGALSIQDPPDGIGLYDDSTTLNVFRDTQTDDLAGWLLHLATWDEARYPQVTVRLHRHPSLIDDVLDLEVGDVIRITNLPKWVAPGDVDLLVDGWTETFRPRAWEITYNCSPAGPYTVGVYDTDRRDTAGSQLSAGVSSTATSLSVATTLGPVWTQAAGDMPFNILVGGEEMTVSAISSASSPQTFTISARSVNGVVKSHTSATKVQLAQPAIRAL